MPASILGSLPQRFRALGWLGVVTMLVACGSADGASNSSNSAAGAPTTASEAQGGAGAATSGGAAAGGTNGATLGGAGGSLPNGGTANNGGTSTGTSTVGGPSYGGQSAQGGSISAGGQTTTGGSSTVGGQTAATGGKAATGGNASAGATAPVGGQNSGGQATAGQANGGTAPMGGAAGASGGSSFPTTLTAIGANGTNGIDWPLVTGATAYRIYWSTTPGVTPQTGTRIEVADPGEVHGGVTNGTPYYYVVTAMIGGAESQPSPVATATPGGEWVLKFLGHGQFQDLVTSAPVAKIPVADRNHVLLFPEGYLSTDLLRFDTDVGNWMTGLFGIDPYSRWKESFVVWSLPRASATRTGGINTAFLVPVTASGATYVMGSGPFTGELATRMWAAILAHPFAPTRFGNGMGGMGTVEKATAAFLILDPSRNPVQAGISGLTTTVTNPSASTQRIATAFGIGHEHEFTHAFTRLVDEYLEEDLAGRTWPTDGQSNVVNSNLCSALPWSHLLYNAGLNNADQLVGAFGRSHIGFHSELLCQMNGSHDNATYYGTANLRAARLCNFCREMTAFRILSRVGLVAAFSDWTGNLRAVFYQRFSMNIPATLPQQTSAGASFFEPCAAALQATPAPTAARWMTPVGPTRIGDVLLEPADLEALGWLPN